MDKIGTGHMKRFFDKSACGSAINSVSRCRERDDQAVDQIGEWAGSEGHQTKPPTQSVRSKPRITSTNSCNGMNLRPVYDLGLQNQKPKPKTIIRPKSTKKLVDRRLSDLLITVASRFSSFEVVRKRTSLPR